MLRIDVEARDELGDLHIRTLYAELMGKYANLVLVTRRASSSTPSSASLSLKTASVSSTPAHATLCRPRTCASTTRFPADASALDDNGPLGAQLLGFSPLLGREVEYRMRQGEAASIMREIRESHVLYLHSTVKKQTLFHCIPLTHLQSEAQTYPLMEGMDALFYEKEQKVRIKQQSGDLFRVIRRELSKNRNKLPKLSGAG
ncbi:MAG: NFACT family protein [Merdibacter sp.]